MRNSSLCRFLMFAALLGITGCSKPGVAPDAANSSSGNGENSAPNAGGNANYGNAPASSEPSKSSGGFAALFSPKPIIIDAGTGISVTADQAVSSKTSNPGDHFDASLSAPILVGEKQVIPSGARAIGTVTAAKSAGKFKGHAEISVTLSSIVVGGQEYEVRTNSVTSVSKGRGERTAIGVGGGAGLGALIGAIAGGGKGAAIGAAAGAGAGTAGAAYTGNRDITIAPETKLHFRLREPLEIKGK
jgi:hypothetical protein